MKRKLILIVLTIVLTGLIPAASVSAFTASDIRPANAQSNPDDYSLIIMDSDKWEMRMNLTSESYYVARYKGVLHYNWQNYLYTGNLSASYDKIKKVLLITAIDAGWGNRTISYALQASATGEKYLGKTWGLTGNYLFLESGYSYKIGADVVKGALPS